jgi:hypothetical protein
MGLSPQDLAEISVSCNPWDESVTAPTTAGTAGYVRNAALRNHFPNRADGLSQDESDLPLG